MELQHRGPAAAAVPARVAALAGYQALLSVRRTNTHDYTNGSMDGFTNRRAVDRALDRTDPAEFDSVLAELLKLYPAAGEEVRQRLQARADQAREAAASAEREFEQADTKAEAERARGRPESELTWGDCVRETGIVSSAI